MHATVNRFNDRTGFTLVEVMITLSVTALLCLAVFAGLQTVSGLSVESAVRTEAYRVLQSEAERLSSVDYGSFVASGNQTTTSSFKTSFLAGTESKFSYPSAGTTGRVAFVHRAVAVSSTSNSTTLRVEVQWSWGGQSNLISMPLYRTR